MDNVIIHYARFTREQRVEVQKAIDTMYKGLAAQDWKSSTTVDVNGSGVKCRYRGDNGTKCAVGHLIPDEIYTPELETQMPTIDAELQAVLKTHSGLEHADHTVFTLLREYQRIHDRASLMSNRNMQEDFEKYTLACGFVINKEN